MVNLQGIKEVIGIKVQEKSQAIYSLHIYLPQDEL